MEPLTLGRIESAFHSSFAVEFCSEDDLPFWSPENPSRGHCAVAALTLNDLLGGHLLVADVLRDGIHVGVHYWNRLAGVDIDLTRQQFRSNEVVGAPQIIERPPGRPRDDADQYDGFRARVGLRLTEAGVNNLAGHDAEARARSAAVPASAR